MLGLLGVSRRLTNSSLRPTEDPGPILWVGTIGDLGASSVSRYFGGGGLG